MARNTAQFVRAVGLAAEAVRVAQVPDQGGRGDHQNHDGSDEGEAEEGLHGALPSRCAGILPVGKYSSWSRSCSASGMGIGIRA